MAKCLAVEWVDFCRVNCISPGFIATDILDIHPKKWSEKWLDMVPAKRFAQAYELKGVSSAPASVSVADIKGVCVLRVGCIELYDWGGSGY